MRESNIERSVCEYARKTGWLALKFVCPGRRGVPDRQFISPTGKIAFVEFKAPKKSPTVLQLREIGILKSRGVRVEWFDSADNAKRWLDSILAEG
jgi:hypothetical protein